MVRIRAYSRFMVPVKRHLHTVLQQDKPQKGMAQSTSVRGEATTLNKSCLWVQGRWPNAFASMTKGWGITKFGHKGARTTPLHSDLEREKLDFPKTTRAKAPQWKGATRTPLHWLQFLQTQVSHPWSVYNLSNHAIPLVGARINFRDSKQHNIYTRHARDMILTSNQALTQLKLKIRVRTTQCPIGQHQALGETRVMAPT